MLEVRKIDAGYGDVQVLFSLSLEVKEREIVTLLGSNGAGKTTTLRCICGIVRPRQGEVLFKGRPVSEEAAAERAGMGIALVPEGRELWPQLTVRENLELGAYHGRARARAKENLDRVHSLFPRLLERKSQLAGSLSGGEQQMCAIGRGLMSRPQLMMIDELSLGLGPLVVDEIIARLPDLAAAGTSVLLVEQDVDVALTVADRAYVLETGRIVLSGSSAQLRADPGVQSAYLGVV